MFQSVHNFADSDEEFDQELQDLAQAAEDQALKAAENVSVSSSDEELQEPPNVAKNKRPKEESSEERRIKPFTRTPIVRPTINPIPTQFSTPQTQNDLDLVRQLELMRGTQQFNRINQLSTKYGVEKLWPSEQKLNYIFEINKN